MSSVAGNEAPPGAGADDRRPRLDRPLRRLMFWMLPGNLGIFLVWSAVPAILIPLQLSEMDDANKVANLALVTSIGALAGMLAQPIAGAISDRTRSRFGRRAPWMVASALVGGLALVGMGVADTVVHVVIAWVCVQVAYNFIQAPVTAILPDRVPTHARGRFSTVIGLATMLGGIVGQGAGAAFAQSVGTGYVVLAGLTIVLITLFVVFNPDSSSRDLERPRLQAGAVLRSFWINPVRHPDFWWAFVGRFLLYTGYFCIYGYNLFLLQDYVGLGDRAPAVIPLLGVAGLLGILPAIALTGPLSDRLGRRKIFVLVSSLLISVAMIFPWVSPTVGGMVAMAVCSGVGFGIFQAIDTALVTEVLPDAVNAAGKDLGVVNIASALPQAVAPALGGVVVLTFSYAGLFPVALLLSLLGALSVLFIRSVR